mmetsp:Transcript_14611/g.21580  ORF Transcript_14611/g.21580 Transcript_14611/m.21580 type:complete len:214 (-) Transcript_14611:735-1376(-)
MFRYNNWYRVTRGCVHHHLSTREEERRYLHLYGNNVSLLMLLECCTLLVIIRGGRRVDIGKLMHLTWALVMKLLYGTSTHELSDRIHFLGAGFIRRERCKVDPTDCVRCARGGGFVIILLRAVSLGLFALILFLGILPLLVSRCCWLGNVFLLFRRCLGCGKHPFFQLFSACERTVRCRRYNILHSCSAGMSGDRLQNIVIGNIIVSNGGPAF